MPNIDASVNCTGDTNVASNSGSGSDECELPCCKIGDDVFYSLVDALNKTTSNEIISITSDAVMLSSIVTLEGVENITIIGHVNSTTVLCNDIGAVKFVNCNNVTIEGINWERCGLKTMPAIGAYNSSSVVFENCSFLYSTGQAVVLSNISGIVCIKYCHFTHNNQQRGHGAALYYLSSTGNLTQTMISIDNSRFDVNVAASSVVYIGALNNEYPRQNNVQNSIFIHNKGVPIYISQTSLHLSGYVLFKGNEADNGGGIYSNSSTVTFDGKSNVSFSDNSVTRSGGALYQIKSGVFFRGNSKVTFTNNSAANKIGGAIYSVEKSFVSFTDDATVIFSNNNAHCDAGAIFSKKNSNITFDVNSKVHFYNNSAEHSGGAMRLFDNTAISFGGNSMTTFNNNKADYGGAIAWYKSTASFSRESIVTFDHNIATVNGGAMYNYMNSNISLNNNTIVKFSSNRAKFRGGAVHSRYHSYVVFQGNSFVSFIINTARYGGAVHTNFHSRISFNDLSTTTFTENTAKEHAGALYGYDRSSILFMGNSMITFKENKAFTGEGGAICCNYHCNILFNGNSNVTFRGNSAVDSGGAVYTSSNSFAAFSGNSFISFIHNSAWNGGAISWDRSTAWFSGDSIVTFEHNIGSNGGAMYCAFQYIISFHENSTVKFFNNTAAHYGGAVHNTDYSNVTFHGNSFVSFTNNTAKYGGAIHIYNNSGVSFDDVSTMIFTENTANENGGALGGYVNSNISFMGNSTITFTKNKATYEGGAVRCNNHCNILFSGNSNVTFSKNIAVEGKGGAVDTRVNSHAAFSEKSYVLFILNSATNGGAMACDKSTASFSGDSVASFDHNIGREWNGGAIYCVFYSFISFHENSTVKFYNNRAVQYGGAVHNVDYSHVIFYGNSFVSFVNNAAKYGGAIHVYFDSRVLFDNFSTTAFVENTANKTGGALGGFDYSNILFMGNSKIIFKLNKATTGEGGAVRCNLHCNTLFTGNSNVTFSENSAVEGGAIDTRSSSDISIRGSSQVTFTNNDATEGGAMQCAIQSSIMFDGHVAVVTFIHNRASRFGGAISVDSSVVRFSSTSLVEFSSNIAETGGAVSLNSQSGAIFQDNCNVTFSNNKCKLTGGALFLNSQITLNISGASLINFHNNEAKTGGGAIYSYDNCNITISNKSEVFLSGNRVGEYGGGIHCEGQSDITLEGNVSIQFINNSAQQGGAVYISQSCINFSEDSFANFTSNTAINGGAIYLANNFLAVFSHGSSITFVNNAADRYGGTILVKLTEHVNSTNIIINTTEIDIHSNTAIVGNFIYIHVPSSCDEICVTNSIIIVDDINIASLRQRQFGKLITTPPSKLVLHDPASCIDDDNGTNCQIYFVKNIMLGQEIRLDACVVDYFNESAGTTQFIISTGDQDHQIAGSDYVLISCDISQRISVIGSKVTKVEKFLVHFSSHSESQLELKTISVQLVVQLSPCYHGFHYDNKTRKCICYSDNDIISCTDSTSIIKEGYWFGVVDGKATVTICPNNYCNFTCCKTTNEFYQLSPERTNQCLSHRSGSACGSCEEGYTLSFDSVECVSIDKCTTGHTVLVVVLSMIYWIVIVILVFIVTYYHAGIGYFYAITYYYSVVDILLSEHLYISKGLLTTVSVMSSIAKITPQFLGQLCFVKYQSGIDQQFIHYAHPLAVTIIVTIICFAARISYRFSAFVSKGIIHVICFLLLLSYTSVATTSLLLLRSLTFHNLDKVYTYLSPDIEYFHSRHLPYVIIAILCTLVIVIGLPLLLLMEPFVNNKINFTKIKPLLDQFQGCYKDKYRYFAAYYMICRLVVILIIIANLSNNSTPQYLLITVNAILALIHMTFKPYCSEILNIFDGFVLQMMIVVSMIPLVDSSDSGLLLAFTLVTLPLIAFLIMEIYLYKSTIKKITEHCMPSKPDTTNDHDEIPMRDFVDSVIDDDSRKNAYICEIKESVTYDEATHYRDSFIEVMNEIKDCVQSNDSV
ncbi:probable outer membrane protein pmp20 [Dysidea avara]|uniref:probable outer membrane protein pmp20 n=1 Tax=Dysidea avara TaxID=196820 RepID=UPI0033202D6B